jgi:hypothetical protein
MALKEDKKMSIKVGSVSELGIDSRLAAVFYRDNWERKIALSDETFYNWQFKTIPSAPSLDNCVVAFDANSRKIVGVMGLNERQFSLDGERKPGAELTTWIVSKECQGSGVGPKILEYIQTKYEVLIGMGISSMALPIYMRSGFRYLNAIPRFTKVFNFDVIQDISAQTALARKLAASWGKATDGQEYHVDEGVDKAESLHARVRGRLNLFTRDVEHLKWRYVDHPYFDYKPFVITLPENESQAFVCLREETSINGFRMLHVLDCFGDEKAIPAALSFVDSYCINNNFDVVDFYCTSAKINKFLLSSGWFSTMDDKCFQMPHLFHPIELRDPPTTSLIYWAKHNFVEMCDFSKLYITKQDADFDRPTLST